ncbi:MAG: hypothetical protein ACI4KM_07485 [Oscillospiraceae bacterium]
MSILRETAPTIEEYREEVKKVLLDDYKQYTPEEVENMINSDDGKMFIEDRYNHNLTMFENNEITRAEFLKIGIRAAAFNIDMCF